MSTKQVELSDKEIALLGATITYALSDILDEGSSKAHCYDALKAAIDSGDMVILSLKLATEIAKMINNK